MTQLAADAATQLLVELVGIDSVNPGLVDGAAGEAEIVAFLKRRLESRGFETAIVHAPGRTDRPSLVAIGPGDANAPTVILNGHLDTVGVAGMPEPFTARIDGDRMYGRGTADMKGGVAALVVAAEALVALGANVRPVLALVADEEDANQGSEAVIAALACLGVHPGACVIAEPTGLELCRSLRGFGVVNVAFAGRAAHSSQAELGVNAVTHLGRLLAAIDEAAPAHRAAGGDLMATVVRGGSSPFVIPDAAECVVEVRTAPGEVGASALALVNQLLEPQWNARAELIASRDGWCLDDTGVAAELADRLGQSLGTSVSFDAPYWMEAPLWQAVCPTVICGPTGDGLHSVDEWVSLSQVRAFTNALIDTLAAWSPR